MRSETELCGMHLEDPSKKLASAGTGRSPLNKISIRHEKCRLVNPMSSAKSHIVKRKTDRQSLQNHIRPLRAL